MKIYCINRALHPKPSRWLGFMPLLLLAYLLANPYVGFGQDADLKRLQRLDSKAKKDTADLARMLSITAELRQVDPEQAQLYLEKIRVQAEEINYYRGLANYCDQIYYIYRGRKQFEEVSDIIQGIDKQYGSKFAAEDQVTVRIALASLLYDLKQLDEALAAFSALLPEATDRLQQARIHYTRGNVYRDKGDYKEAVSDHLNALELYEAINRTDDATNACIALGNAYADMEDFHQSIRYYQQAMRYAEQTGHLENRGLVYSNIATAYRKLDSNEVALDYLRKGLDIARKLDNPQRIAQSLMNIANVQLTLENFTEALESFQSSLDLCYAHDIKYGIMLNYLNTGSLYMRMKDFPNAKQAYDSAMVYTRLLKLPKEESVIYEHYASFFTEMGNYRSALTYYKAFHELQSKIINEEKQKAIAELEVKYETELKDREIVLVNQQYEEKRAQNRALMLGIVLVVLATGFIVFFLVYRNRTLRELYDRNVELLNAYQSSKKKPQREAEDTAGWDIHKQVFEGLLELLESEGIYKNPNLTLSDVAELLKTNGTYLSGAIAAHAKMNFNNFINFYRVNEAKRLIHEMGYRINLNEAMYACGFHSRTTFYNAFNKFTGMSPKQFKYMATSEAGGPDEGDEAGRPA